MSLAIVYSRAQLGLRSPLVTIEVHLSNGLPSLSIVGLPEAAVRESKDRVRAALLNGRFEFPTRRITINLAPADLPKEGGRYDLAIALGILVASGQLPQEPLAGHEFLGELSLDGRLRRIRAAIPAAIASQRSGRRLVVPEDNRDECALIDGGATTLAADGLLAVCAHLHGRTPLPPCTPQPRERPPPSVPDLAEVQGQAQARRALEIAAAGEHHLLMVGPPGSGKTMLASRLPGLLPPLDASESMERLAIESLISDASTAVAQAAERRPFRRPHHSSSSVALVGGGGRPRPGEITLAHNGVLFLDELPEFDRRAIEALREPLEAGTITISRAALQVEFPARFQLVAAMNPCPCGYLGDPSGRCRCSPEQVRRYQQRVSGPLLDRIDMQIAVRPLPARALACRRGTAPETETSATVRERVALARRRQIERQGCPNGRLDADGTLRHCAPPEEAEALLERAIDRLGLSARAYHRVLRLARTIADLAAAPRIRSDDLAEALAYRRNDGLSPGGDRPQPGAVD